MLRCRADDGCGEMRLKRVSGAAISMPMDAICKLPCRRCEPSGFAPLPPLHLCASCRVVMSELERVPAVYRSFFL